MPLTMVPTGEINLIKKIGGNSKTKRHLESLGFVPGGSVVVVSKMNGNYIVNVKESRLAISHDLACKILV